MLPAVGTKLSHSYKDGSTYEVTIDPTGVNWNGSIYSSLSAAAKAIQSSRGVEGEINGRAYFGINDGLGTKPRDGSNGHSNGNGHSPKASGKIMTEAELAAAEEAIAADAARKLEGLRMARAARLTRLQQDLDSAKKTLALYQKGVEDTSKRIAEIEALLSPAQPAAQPATDSPAQ
jgi:hypothetical protein